MQNKPMTKERLEKYRSHRKEIEEIEYAMQNRWKSENMIGSDVILDYSRSYPPIPQTVTGFDQKKYERQQDADLHRKLELEQECKEIEEFVKAIPREMNIERRIFNLYYIYGEKKVTQEYVANRMSLDRSRVSRKIDEYLKNAHKTQKAQL